MSMRLQKVAELIKQEVSLIIQSGLKDERVGFVTVTKVEVSPDLRNAKVFVTIMEERKSRNKTFRGLKSAAGFISKELGDRLSMKYCPRLMFIEDKGMLHAFDIEQAIERIHKEAPYVQEEESSTYED